MPPSASPVTFLPRTSTGALHWAPVPGDGTGLWSGVRTGTPHTGELTLLDAWNRLPLFFFLAAASSDLEALIPVPGGSAADACVAWVPEPDARPTAPPVIMMALRRSADGTWRLAESVAIPFGAHRLILPAGTGATPGARELRLDGAFSLSGPEVGGGLELASLSLGFAGPEAGSFSGSGMAAGHALAGLGLAVRRRLGEESLSLPLIDRAAALPFEVRLDPLRPFLPKRSALTFTPATPWPTGFFLRGADVHCPAAVLHPDDAAPPPSLWFAPGGGLRFAGQFALDPAQSHPSGGARLLCGLVDNEWFTLKAETRLALRLDADADLTLEVVGGPSCTYVDSRRRRTLSPIPRPVRLLPVLPYGASSASRAQLMRLEAEQMIPLRRGLSLPEPPAPPRPAVAAPIQIGPRLEVARKVTPPPGWTLPDTRDDKHIGTMAVFTSADGQLRLELGGLGPSLVERIAKPDPQGALLRLGAEDVRTCRLGLAGTAVVLDPREWRSGGTGLTIRLPGGTIPDDLKASLLGQCPDTAPDLVALCESGLDAADTSCVLLAAAAGPLPAPLAPCFGGLGGRIAALRAPRWWAAATAGPRAGSASAAAVTFEDALAPARDGGLGAVSLTGRLRVGGGWDPLLRLRVSNWLRHPCAAGSRLDIRAESAGTGERLTIVDDAVTLAPHGPLQTLSVTGVAAEAAALEEAEGAAAPPRRFILAGRMGLRALPTDILSFGPSEDRTAEGGLAFGGVALVFETADAALRARLDDEMLTLDRQASIPRPGSLHAAFPLGAPHWVCDRGGTTPAALGYLPVVCAGAEGTPGAGWAGLRHTLDAGAFAALAAAAGAPAELLIAWQPDAPTGGVAVGLKLPGSGGAPALSLAGLFKLGFRTLELVSWIPESGPDPRRHYALRLQEVKASFLSLLEFPPGRTDLTLIGNPAVANRPGAEAAFGWFAAFAKQK